MTTVPFPSIGILGFGAFGRLASSQLAPHRAVTVFDPRADENAIRTTGAAPGSLEDAAACDAVILAVPVQAIPDGCDAIAAHLMPGALVCDVGSVKTKPLEWMLERLPKHAQILGTHPLFGPETASELGTIAGEPIVVCPGRCDDETAASVRAFLAESLGLRVIDLSADEHDKQMAFIQGITHLIGRAGVAMDLPDLETGTLAYRRLMQMKHNTERDAPELFDAIQRLNPHAAGARRAFLEAVREVDENIES